jgi:hypothetical protein
MLSDERDQLGSVAGLADDVEPSALEQARQTFAKQNIVVRQGHSRSALRHAPDYRLASPHAHAGASCRRVAETLSAAPERHRLTGWFVGIALVAAVTGVIEVLSTPRSGPKAGSHRG